MQRVIVETEMSSYYLLRMITDKICIGQVDQETCHMQYDFV